MAVNKQNSQSKTNKQTTMTRNRTKGTNSEEKEKV